jgi:rod shape-determining protein MreC
VILLVTVVRHRAQAKGGVDPLTDITRRVLFSPVLHAGNIIARWWEIDIYSIFHGPSLARANRRLEERMANLMQQTRSLADEAEENIQLRALLSFKAHDQRDLVPAEVLALKPFSERDSAIFSRGTKNNVTVKEPALDEDGNLVGQVTSISSDTCDVMLLTDTLSSVGARVVPAQQPPIAPSQTATTGPAPSLTTTLPSTPAFLPTPTTPTILPEPAPVGICVGDHSNLLQLTDLAPDADVEVGDTVVTSGLGGVYPKDIPIGRVVEVDFDKTRYLKSALVAPSADFNHLQEGFLLR